MTELAEVAIFDLIFRVFSVFYLAVAAVEFFQWIPWTSVEKDFQDKPVRKIRVLDRKPFNCVLCMVFWMGILVAYLPLMYSFVLAGMALLLFKLMKRLEIFGV